MRLQERIPLFYNSMYTAFRNKVAAHLERNSIHTDEEIYQYLTLFIALAYCLVIHIYLLVTYIAFQIPFLIGLNVVSISISFILLFLHRLRKYKVVALILTAEVSFYATLTILFTGISNLTLGYYLLVIVLQVILPYGSVRLRMVVVFLIMALAFSGAAFSLHHTPAVVFPRALSDFLTISNVFILFVGTTVQLLIGNIVRQIMEQLNQNRMAKLSALANTDPLTGLFNRRYAESYFTDILNTRKDYSYCVAMLDIDDFKSVNDSLGHHCGDEVLVFLAEFLTKNLRRSDIVFRWGGEEFLLVLENIDLPTAYTILDKLRAKLENTSIHAAEHTVHITATIGVSVLDIENSSESIKKADANLYIGKHKTKNMVIAG